MKTALWGVLLAAACGFSQETYSTWTAYKNITINTTTDTANGGASVANTVTNFPTLVRLTSANADVFSQSLANGADIRFTDASGAVRLSHQVERWDTASKSAEFWVLVPSVAGNATTTFRIYWGKSGAADSSKGTATFDTANGFQAVWHMNKGDTTSEADATLNGFNQSEINGPIDSVGVIGRARRLNGTNQRFQAANTASSKLNFQLTDSYTLSAWMYPYAITTTANSGHKIIDKGDNQYVLAIYDAATPKYWEITTRGNNAYNQCRSNGTPTITGDASVGAWHHLVGTYQGAAVGQPVAESLYYDGVLINTWAGTNTNNTGRNLTYNVSLGVQAAGTAPGGTTFTRYWNGLLDEVEMSNVSRSPAWIKLQYATEKPGANAVTLGTSTPNIPGFPTVTNPANQALLAGATARFKVTATGNATLVYKWVRRNIDTVGTNADSLILTNVSNADTGSYKCVVRNTVGQVVSSPATLTILTLPAISQQPSDVSLNVGGTARFGVVATGTTPRTYKWVKNNTDTLTNPSASTDTLILANVQVADSGTYKCVVRNVAGQAVSNAARLTVTPVAIVIQKLSGSMGVHASGSIVTFSFPSTASGVQVSVRDVLGHNVWSRKAVAGATEISWDRKAGGNSAQPGIYYVRVSADVGGKSKILAESKLALTR